jgi:hypothetical protein
MKFHYLVHNIPPKDPNFSHISDLPPFAIVTAIIIVIIIMLYCYYNYHYSGYYFSVICTVVTVY